MPYTTIACLATLLLTATGVADTRQPTLVRVDALDRVYPDRPASAVIDSIPVSTPRNASVVLQFAATSPVDLAGRVIPSPVRRKDGTPLDATIRTYRLLPVHIEGNTQGSKKNRPGGPVPDGWMKSLVRAAPFDVMEVLVESNDVELSAGCSHALLLEVEVASDASPGLYEGSLGFRFDHGAVSAPFSLEVHKTVLPPTHRLHCVHWFSPIPENLTSDEPPPWWSERHWTLIRNSARQLWRFGDDTMLTPLINGRQPLIQVSRDEQDEYEFDYSRFDRWVETFLELGFSTFAGCHVVYMGSDVRVLNSTSNEIEPLLRDKKDQDAWPQFLPVFYRSLARHLDERGWTERYIQHQYDEPRDAQRYERLAALARTHMPRVRTIDAINSRPELYSPLVDIHVFNLITLLNSGDLANRRRLEGKAVWLYHCTSPYPPYPNRHLDRPLAECRLWPWICHKWKAEGFLYWAANLYRGADEYKTSIGPFPNGSQDPGHPPGDAWFYYRGREGLQPSMRIVAFRAGLIDHTLLTMLANEDEDLAVQITGTLIRSATDYSTDPAAYHAARRRILEALDKRVAPTR